MTWFGWLRSSRAGMLGPDHPATIAAQVSLGRALAAAGQPDEAVPPWSRRRPQRAGPRTWRWHLGRAGRIRRRVPGRGQGRRGDPPVQAAAGRPRAPARPGYPGTLAVRLRLAGACLAAGKAKDAIAQCKTVLAGREQALGPDHPDTLAARAALAAAYDAAGQMGAALHHHQEACAGYERVFGTDHPGTLACRADLARAYAAAGPGRRGREPAPRHHRPQRAGPVPGDPLTRALRQALAEITGEMTAR